MLSAHFRDERPEYLMQYATEVVTLVLNSEADKDLPRREAEQWKAACHLINSPDCVDLGLKMALQLLATTDAGQAALIRAVKGLHAAIDARADVLIEA